MLVHKAYRYELKLTRTQLASVARHAGAARFAYNWGLDEIKKGFRKKGRNDSFRLTGSIKLEGERRVVLPRLGSLRVKERTTKLQRGLTAGTARIMSVTVRRVADKWFVSFTVLVVIPDPVEREAPGVGVDIGIRAFAVVSDGQRFTRPDSSLHKQLANASRAMARKGQGSSNRRKAELRLQRLPPETAEPEARFLAQGELIAGKNKARDRNRGL